nr:unnamed protein product [Spirometra erinaceieuropaei]
MRIRENLQQYIAAYTIPSHLSSPVPTARKTRPNITKRKHVIGTSHRLNYLKSEGLLEAEPYHLEPDLQGVDTTGQKPKVGRLDMHEFEVCVQFWKSLLRRQQCFGANRGNKRLAPTSVANQSVQPATRMEEPTALKVIALDDQEKVMRCQLEEIREGIEELLRQRRRSRRRQIKQ